MIFKCTLLVLYVASFAYSADILAIIPTPSYSHQVDFFDLWNQLSLRGHKVTVITTDPQKNEQLTNLTEIDVSWSYKFFADVSQQAEKSMSLWNVHQWFSVLSYNISEEQLSSHKIQELIHHREKHFEVLLLESFYPEYLGFAEIYKCPIIIISSMDAFTNMHHRMGNTAHPILYPEVGSSWHAPLIFKERVLSTVYSLYTSIFYDYISYTRRDKLLHRFFNSTSTVSELLNNADMLFVNVNPVIQGVRAIGPSTINIGGLRSMSIKALPKDLQEFLDSATHGFVYFSLGSNVKSKDLQEESLNAIVEALGELPYKVLWKFEAEESDIPQKPDNVKLIKWAPQISVLAHPNIKVFVTQGGLQSMEESIHNEVPCVVIPFFGDQQQNARLMRNKGIAVTIGRHPFIDKEELKNAILEVINNPKYKNAVSRIRRLSLDTPMTGLEKAVWWTEYVIRNKGAKHLRNPAADLPFYQYYLLDVVGFLVSIIVVPLAILIVLLKKIYKLLVARFSQKSSLVNKKLQ